VFLGSTHPNPSPNLSQPPFSGEASSFGGRSVFAFWVGEVHCAAQGLLLEHCQGSAVPGTPSLSPQAQCFGQAIAHLSKLELQFLPENLQALEGLEFRDSSRREVTAFSPAVHARS